MRECIEMYTTCIVQKHLKGSEDRSKHLRRKAFQQ